MIISRTPYRISFFGGGTDYPSWYRTNGGQVVATTIDKYLYITCRKLPRFFDHQLRLVYSEIETCKTAEELTHPSARETLKYLKATSGLEIHYDGDLPGRSGMGSSSAFTVGLVNAIYAFQGKSITAEQLAQDSIHIEQNLVGEVVGSQDQVSAAYGGFNRVKFFPSGKIVVEPISISYEREQQLDHCSMLFYTGMMRIAGDVAATYVSKMQSNSSMYENLYALASDAYKILIGNGDLDEFGHLLHENWLVKRGLSSQVSNSVIDRYYETARSAGALGGKVVGAGNGGMLLLYVPIERQDRVKEKLSALLNIPFSFESTGSRIIYPETSPRSWQVPTLLMEDIYGFNAVGYDGTVYGILQGEGAFEIERIHSKRYSRVFQGLDLQSVEMQIKNSQLVD